MKVRLLYAIWICIVDINLEIIFEFRIYKLSECTGPATNVMGANSKGAQRIIGQQQVLLDI